MRVLITSTAALNTGDAAILYGAIEVLRQVYGRDLKFVVYDQQAAVARRYYPEMDFRPVLFEQVSAWSKDRSPKIKTAILLLSAYFWRTRYRRWLGALLPERLRATLDEFAAADLVLASGGTYLVPHYRVLPKLLDLAVAAAMDCPFVLFTQSVGPFSTRRLRLVRAILSRARMILVRDAPSRHHLIRAGVAPDRIRECADAAFALAVSRRGRAGSGGRRRRVAVSVRDWPHIEGDTEAGMARYLDAMALFVLRLLRDGDSEVTFLSTCQGVPEYWTDDAVTADLVVARLPQALRRAVRVDREFHSPSELMALLEGFDAVVATRMHLAILSLAVGTPVVPIAYEFKTNELFAKLGLSNLVQDIETVTAESLHDALQLLRAEALTAPAGINERVDVQRLSAVSAGLSIRKAMEGAW